MPFNLICKGLNLFFQVRITASWALANICDSIRHYIDTFALEGSTGALHVTEIISDKLESLLI